MSSAFTAVSTVSGIVTITATETYTSLPTTLVDTIEHLGINSKAIFPLVLSALVGALIIIYVSAFVGYIFLERRKQKLKKVNASKSPHANDIPLQNLAPRAEEGATEETSRYKNYLLDFMDENFNKRSKKSTIRRRSKSGTSSTASLPITLNRKSDPFDDSNRYSTDEEHESLKGGDSPGKHSWTDLIVSPPPPYRTKSIKGNPVFNRTMGLQKLDLSTWLVVNNKYLSFHNVRTSLLNTRRSEVIQIKHTPKVEEACEELLDMVSGFLLERYPANFGRPRELHPGGKAKIKSRMLNNVVFDLEPPFALHPLEICARLAIEDFNILMKNEKTGEHHLQASVTLFPAGWRLAERIGWPVSKLHDLIPRWRSKLAGPVEKYLSRLNAESSMQRHAYFIQIIPRGQPFQQSLFVQDPKDFYPTTDFTIDDVWLRTERQTFRVLPKTKAVVFTVKTDMRRLVEIDEDELHKLEVEIKSWPDDVAKYRGKHVWGNVVLEYVDKAVGVDYDDPFFNS